ATAQPAGGTTINPPVVLPGVRPRVAVANRRDGGFFFWLAKLYAFSVLVIVAAVFVTLVGVYSWFSINADPVPDISRYAAQIAPGTSRIVAADGTVLGEFAKQWREIVPYERIPKQLVDAFLAVEDHEFFDHRGIYVKGIVRALWRNLSSGDFAQGGSTITQQVAKQFIGNKKSLARKGMEAIMARRLEATYSKRAILAVYLNHIFLGSGAWGVAAAAHRYFNKDLDQLTLSECALIAGLAKAPSKYSPLNKPKLAVERRNVVLDKMAGYGFASGADVAAAKSEPLKLESIKKSFPERMPYYAEHVRRYLLDVYKEPALYADGLRVETAGEPTWEAAAYENVDFGARNQDKRQGWRGPEWRVDGAARDLFLARQKQLYGAAPLVAGKRYLALVDKVDDNHAEVLIGERRFQLPLRNMRWASRWVKGNADNDIPVGSALQVVKPKDVVWVSKEIRTVGKFRAYNLPDAKNPQWVPSEDNRDWDQKNNEYVRLEQVPHPSVTIFTADHRTGYIAAMVGGNDYERSVFNRAVQACRQPGSTYKPIYYALGLDQGYGFDSVFTDVPFTVIDKDTGEAWTPTNLDNASSFSSSLEYALVFSKNVPSLALFQALGAKNVEAWARRMGFTTKIFADEALALGASCSKLDEMARAFTLYARNGAWWPRTKKGGEKDWVYVKRVVDRHGKILEDATQPEDPMLSPADRLDRTVALAGVVPPQAISPRVGYLMNRLLANEVTYGFAQVLRETKINAAGKTGTSSATHDVMFIAYTSKFTTLVWMGDDKKERAIGRQDAAYMTVVPLWSRYMLEAARGYPNPTIPWNVPPGVRPDDRGDHTRGVRGPPMDLIFRTVKKPKKEDDGGASGGEEGQPPA
ncbi:MAG: transglycosylase domain-containing protein, partial [Deltaproteobacteria bacterium]|nr:transglycosylase domain-containing protein [Deltaproteobacteria bacterium]